MARAATPFLQAGLCLTFIEPCTQTSAQVTTAELLMGRLPPDGAVAARAGGVLVPLAGASQPSHQYAYATLGEQDDAWGSWMPFRDGAGAALDPFRWVSHGYGEVAAGTSWHSVALDHSDGFGEITVGTSLGTRPVHVAC